VDEVAHEVGPGGPLDAGPDDDLDRRAQRLLSGDGVENVTEAAGDAIARRPNDERRRARDGVVALVVSVVLVLVVEMLAHGTVLGGLVLMALRARVLGVMV
jgi:hypothetical protein